MREDERDILEVLIFDEIEETVGTWLRTIIQRLEKEQTANRRDHHKQPKPKRRNIGRNAPLPEGAAECAKPTFPTEVDRRRQVVPISGRFGFGKFM